MAHFVEINDSNEVIRGVVLDDKDAQDSDGNEDESIGIKYLQDGKSFNLLNSHKGGKADDAVLEPPNEIDTSIPTF